MHAAWGKASSVSEAARSEPRPQSWYRSFAVPTGPATSRDRLRSGIAYDLAARLDLDGATGFIDQNATSEACMLPELENLAVLQELFGWSGAVWGSLRARAVLIRAVPEGLRPSCETRSSTSSAAPEMLFSDVFLSRLPKAGPSRSRRGPVVSLRASLFAPPPPLLHDPERGRLFTSRAKA